MSRIKAQLTSLVVLLASAAAVPAAAPMREIRVLEVSIAGEPPGALTRPEGRTRWDFEGVLQGAAFTRSIEADGTAFVVRERREAAGSPARKRRIIYSDPDGGEAASRWLLPDRHAESMRPGSRSTLVLDEAAEDRIVRLTIDVEVVGIGWVHLPSGPREAILERARILREPEGHRGGATAMLVHRWVDPLDGVVALVAGPAALDGRTRLGIESAEILDAVTSGAGTLKIHVSELQGNNFEVVTYGWDRGAGTTVASLTPDAHANIGALVAASTWDFSGNTSGTEVGATTTPVDPNETCNYDRCGYTVAGGQLERTDKNFGAADPNAIDKINDVAQLEVRANDVTIWLRAGAQHEGRTGSLGSGESRFCYTTFGGVTRSPVPLWQFTHLDAGGTERYFQAGDHWEGGPFNCEQNIFNQLCGEPQLFDTLYVKACGTHTGKQFGDVIKGGVVTLPSGHTFNSLVVRTVADFCVYLGASCGSLGKVDEVRTVNYLWQAPYLGTVVRLQSAQNVADHTSFSTLAETDIHFGLFPPRSITVTGTTDSSVSISWDPGLDTHRIDGYKVYWDTDSGAVTTYGFDSQSNPGQISISGTTATISGLGPGTTYYITVTSLAAFTDPSTHVATTYESLLYPTQVSGDPSFVYPVEVQALTTSPSCIPTSEAQNVTAVRSGADVQFCWDSSADPCATGYRILGSAASTSSAGWGTVADPGADTCWTLSPSGTYFLVTVKGTGGDGPWGHYGQ